MCGCLLSTSSSTQHRTNHSFLSLTAAMSRIFMIHRPPYLLVPQPFGDGCCMIRQAGPLTQPSCPPAHLPGQREMGELLR